MAKCRRDFEGCEERGRNGTMYIFFFKCGGRRDIDANISKGAFTYPIKLNSPCYKVSVPALFAISSVILK